MIVLKYFTKTKEKEIQMALPIGETGHRSLPGEI